MMMKCECSEFNSMASPFVPVFFSEMMESCYKKKTSNKVGLSCRGGHLQLYLQFLWSICFSLLLPSVCLNSPLSPKEDLKEIPGNAFSQNNKYDHILAE